MELKLKATPFWISKPFQIRKKNMKSKRDFVPIMHKKIYFNVRDLQGKVCFQPLQDACTQV